MYTGTYAQEDIIDSSLNRVGGSRARPGDESGLAAPFGLVDGENAGIDCACHPQGLVLRPQRPNRAAHRPELDARRAADRVVGVPADARRRLQHGRTALRCGARMAGSAAGDGARVRRRGRRALAHRGGHHRDSANLCSREGHGPEVSCDSAHRPSAFMTARSPPRRRRELGPSSGGRRPVMTRVIGLRADARRRGRRGGLGVPRRG